MNNFYFYSKQFLKLIDKNNKILQLIYSITQKRNSLIIEPQKILNVPNNQGNQAAALVKLQQQIGTINKEILDIVRSERPNNVYDLVNSFIQDLNLFDPSYNDENSLIKELKDFPEKHTDAYSERQASQIFIVTETSYKISQTIDDIKEKSNFLIEEFTKSSKESPRNYSQLRIGTDQDVPLVEDFVSVFKSLEELYNFICYIYKIDAKVNHLILNQVSTGSWYTEILGIKQVVISIENLLKDIGTFIRDLITGKIGLEKFENDCKKAEVFINLMAVAKRNGIDNAELGVFKHLNPLVETFKNDTTILDVNDEEVLKLRKIDKLTLVERKSKRNELLEKINLSIEAKKDDDKTTTDNNAS